MPGKKHRPERGRPNPAKAAGPAMGGDFAPLGVDGSNSAAIEALTAATADWTLSIAGGGALMGPFTTEAAGRYPGRLYDKSDQFMEARGQEQQLQESGMTEGGMDFQEIDTDVTVHFSQKGDLNIVKVSGPGGEWEGTFDLSEEGGMDWEDLDAFVQEILDQAAKAAPQGDAPAPAAPSGPSAPGVPNAPAPGAPPSPTSSSAVS